MLTHQSTGAGLRLKAWVDFPAGIWAHLPRVPSHTATTLAHIKGLLLFLYLILSPFLLSQQWKSELHNRCTKCNKHRLISLLALNYRSIRSVQLLRALEKQDLEEKRQIDTDRNKTKKTWRRKFCKQWAVFAEDINRIRWSQHNSVVIRLCHKMKYGPCIIYHVPCSIFN